MNIARRELRELESVGISGAFSAKCNNIGATRPDSCYRDVRMVFSTPQRMGCAYSGREGFREHRATAPMKPNPNSSKAVSDGSGTTELNDALNA
jgi:hypothetical protein